MVNGNLCRELRRAVFHGIARRGVAPVAERQFDNVTNKRFYKHRERLHGNNIQIFMICVSKDECLLSGGMGITFRAWEKKVTNFELFYGVMDELRNCCILCY